MYLFSFKNMILMVADKDLGSKYIYNYIFGILKKYILILNF